ncbi:MAG: type III pantothenate kinase [Gammaproteobacteria bacterium]
MLVMDIGNSRIKWRFTGPISQPPRSEAYHVDRLSQQLLEWFDDISLMSPVIVCSVAATEVNDRVSRYFTNRDLVIDFTKISREKAGVSNGYINIDQLGVDRWVAMVSAYNKYQSAVCVIDAGTALTIDVVDVDGHHLGGLIMPGLNLMRQSLLSGTSGISEVSDLTLLLADNTGDGVSAGCVQLLTAGIEPIIERIESHYGLKLVTVVTGGDADVIAKQTDCDLKLDKWLILDGLEQLFVSDM